MKNAFFSDRKKLAFFILVFLLINVMYTSVDAVTTFTKIVDTSTPIPGGTGNFTRIDDFSWHQGMIVFRGEGSDGKRGIYRTKINSAIGIVADTNTYAPDGTGKFTSFNNVSVHSGRIAFSGSTETSVGIYTGPGLLKMIANKKTPIPPLGATGTFNNLACPSLDILGKMAFWGTDNSHSTGIYYYNGHHKIGNENLGMIANEGTPLPGNNFGSYFDCPIMGNEDIYFGDNSLFVARHNLGGAISLIADRNTPMPGGSQNFKGIAEPAFDQYTGAVIFKGSPYSGSSSDGIYKYANGQLSMLYDRSTPVPGGTGNFWSYPTFPSTDNGSVAFVGYANYKRGLYTDYGGSLIEVILAGDTLDGKLLYDPFVEHDSLRGGSILFRAHFADSSGLYVAKIDPGSYDSDNDGVDDNPDNCLFDYNPDQSDVDSDGKGDVCDLCPDDNTDTCNPDRSVGGSIGTAGGSLPSPDGSVSLDIPAGALDEDTSLSISETGTMFQIVTDQGTRTALYGVSIQQDGTPFSTPATITMTWPDEDNDGLVDETVIMEDYLVITKDSVIITNRCMNEDGCDTTANEFSFQVSSLSEFTLSDGEEPALEVCGNGVLDPTEECDDGNNDNGDGCDENCQIEPFCGDGNLDPGEQCDDGNINNGDGCDSNCALECIPTGTPEITCNGIDDDCDGQADEDYVVDDSCGLGVCGAPNNTPSSCVDGVETLCQPGFQDEPTDSTCDGLDNDCDGSTDEDYQFEATTCGVGECAATGATTCVGGVEGDTCTPGTTSPEVCDNLDNDCDGAVDDNLTRATTCGVGECAGNKGEETCTAGTWGNDTCDPLAGATPEVCDDRIDNNCDGEEKSTPLINTLTVSLDLIQAGGEVMANASFIDSNSDDAHTVTWDWGDSTTDNYVIPAGTRSLEETHTYSLGGVYRINLTVSENYCGGNSAIYEYIVVYDPSGGFVTGGGWIDSPEGAFIADPSLSGKASFGFVSKYKKGATEPTGQTEFQFKVADLNFHSNTYQWLVVAGAQAKFKGTGTINGMGNYGFMLSAVDGALPGGGGVDKFRIKIWDKDNNDAIVYDNMLNAPDDAEPTTALAGGSIIIHAK